MSVDDASCWRVAREYLDGFNRRDADAWVSMFHPDVEFRPSAIARSQPLYRGREEARRYLEEVRERRLPHQARIRRIRRIGPEEFAVLTEVLIDGEKVSDAAVIIRLDGDLIAAAAAHLSDEATLESVGVIPGSAEDVPET